MRHIFSHCATQSLYEASRKILDSKGSRELFRQPLDELEAIARFRDTPSGENILKRAATLYASTDDRDVSIDTATIMYYNNDDGYWVLSWCFVDDEAVHATVGDNSDIEPIVLHDEW